MGYQLVGAAMQPEWGRRLTTTERLVLVIMCQLALDDDDTPRQKRTFKAGTAYIILRLRGDVPPKGSPEYRAGKEAVRRALRKLEDLGAIKRTKVAAHGTNAEYLLTPDAPQLPVDKPPDQRARARSKWP